VLLGVFRTGTGGIAWEAYRRTFSSGPTHHWSARMRTAFLPCPKGYVSQRAADRQTEHQRNRSRLSAQASREEQRSSDKPSGDLPSG
jgi:hypothetical protein